MSSAESSSEQHVRSRKPASKTTSTDTTSSSGEESSGLFDVVKALTPLLVIIAIALSMLVLGYIFVPPHALENLSTPPEYDTAHQKMKGEESASAAKVCTEILEIKSLLVSLKEFMQWKQLGAELGISIAAIDEIEHDYLDTENKKRALLRKWYNNQEKVCWEDVVAALKALEHVKLAKKVADKYHVTWDI